MSVYFSASVVRLWCTAGFAKKARVLLLLVAITTPSFYSSGCAFFEKHHALEKFEQEQAQRLVRVHSFKQGELNFWIAGTQINSSDLVKLERAWTDYSGAFPESKTISTLKKSVENPAIGVVLLGVFMPSTEYADLLDKSLGWTIAPQPTSVVELSDSDRILQVLMPLENQWVRYFMVSFPITMTKHPLELRVGNRFSAVNLMVP